MSNESIKSALRSVQYDIKSDLSGLDDDARAYREQLRYYQGKVRDYKASLDSTNRRKRILRRELKKAEAIEYEINPIKNIQKAKVTKHE